MNFFDYKAEKVWIENEAIHVRLTDGRQAKAAIKAFSLLTNATKEQLNKFEIIGSYAIHWPELNEDLSIAGFFETPTSDSVSESFFSSSIK